MNRFSKNNTYSTSDGERLTRPVIESRINKAKKKVIDDQFMTYGYNFCVDCKINAQSAGRLDCSHEISVKECLETGRAELAYSTDNIKPRCRSCHRRHDNHIF